MIILRTFALLFLAAMLLEHGSTSEKLKEPVLLYKNPFKNDELISNTRVNSAALTHSFPKLKLILDEHKRGFQPSEEEALDPAVAIEGQLHHDCDSSVGSDDGVFDMCQDNEFLRYYYSVNYQIEFKLLLFDLGKGEANFTEDPAWNNDMVLDEQFPVDIVQMLGYRDWSKRRAVLVSLPSTFDRLAAKASEPDVAYSRSGSRNIQVEMPLQTDHGQDLVQDPSFDASSEQLNLESKSPAYSEGQSSQDTRLEENKLMMVSKRALQERIIQRIISKVEQEWSDDFIFYEVKQGETFKFPTSQNQYQIVQPLNENKFAKLLEFLKADNLESPLLQGKNSSLLEIRVQDISSSPRASFEFEYHYTYTSHFIWVFIFEAFCSLILLFLSIRMTCCENKRGIRHGQRLIILPILCHFICGALKSYNFYSWCSLFVNGESDYTKNLRINVYFRLLESSLLYFQFSYALERGRLNLFIGFVLFSLLILEVLASFYWNLPTFIRLLQPIQLCFLILTGPFYKEALAKAKLRMAEDQFGRMRDQLDPVSLDKYRYHLNRLEDRVKIALTTKLIIALYNMKLILFLNFICDYQYWDSTYTPVHTVSEFLDLIMLYCLTFAISPHFYFQRGFVRRLFVFPFNIVLPNSEAYADAVNRYQIREEIDIERLSREIEMVDIKKLTKTLDLRELNKDNRKINQLLAFGDRVDEDSLELNLIPPKIKNLKEADENEEHLIVVNPMEPEEDQLFPGCLQQAIWTGGLDEGMTLDIVEGDWTLWDMRDENKSSEILESPDTLDDSQHTTRSLLK